MSRNLEITEYTISNRFDISMAVVADLHGEPFDDIQAAFLKCKPDIICIPGDLCPFITAEHNEASFGRRNNHAMEFLRYALSVAPVYYSRGNNEKDWQITVFSELIRIGVHILENSWEEVYPGLAIGGLSSAHKPKSFFSPPPNAEWLSQFELFDGYKILLSHHPEYYKPYIKPHDIDLVISGHAHGGQIRIGNNGLFAPGQGFFPEFTSSIHDGHLIISRGISRRPYFVPAINNPPELMYIKL